MARIVLYILIGMIIIFLLIVMAGREKKLSHIQDIVIHTQIWGAKYPR